MINVKKYLVFSATFLLFNFIVQNNVSAANGDKTMNDIDNDSIQKVFNKKVYFGHQSVGKNILNGIAVIAPETKDRLIDVTDVTDVNNPVPAFYHSRVGANLDIKRKINDFRKIVESRFSGKLDVAFLKFCYLDITEQTDIKELFNNYKENIENLKESFPEMVFVHFTAPLTINNSSWKTQVKKVLGMGQLWEYADNIKRNEYNRLLLKEYQGEDPVFDLAAIESTYPDGKRESFSFKGETYYALVKEYTTDGGHLNDVGSQRVAAALLDFLAGI